MSSGFTAFAAIDWSGAKGFRHRGIAVALCRRGDGAPELVHPESGTPPPPFGLSVSKPCSSRSKKNSPSTSSGRTEKEKTLWSREGVARWVERQATREPTLFGFDFSFAPPLVERGAYLPGEANIPDTAPAFWAYVDRLCANEADLCAASFLETHHRRHFYFGAADGVKAHYMHLRRCEALYNAGGGGKPSTVYDAIGAAQVAKASFAGMRFLHHVQGKVPVWPFDGRTPPVNASLIVEIYTSLAARAAGRPKGRTKIRSAELLDSALGLLDSRAHDPLRFYSDHATDAILTAAWMRRAADDPRLWSPPSLTDQIARTEGWTFGVI